jgi:hypothetical protein
MKAILRDLILTLVASMVTTSPCFAARDGGGGGKGVVCRDSKKKVISVQLLDIWETQKYYNLKPNKLPKNATLRTLVESGAETLADSMPYTGESFSAHGGSPRPSDHELLKSTLMYYANSFLKSLNVPGIKPADEDNFIPVEFKPGIALPLTHDSFERITPSLDSGCAIEQLAEFNDVLSYIFDQDGILVDKDLFSKMDLLNQASLILHEAYYKYLRDTAGDDNSLRARRVIGYIMLRGGKFHSLRNYLDKLTERIECQSNDEDMIRDMYSPNYIGFRYASSIIHIVPEISNNGALQGERLRIIPQIIQGVNFVGDWTPSNELATMEYADISLQNLLEHESLSYQDGGIYFPNLNLKYNSIDPGSWYTFYLSKKDGKITALVKLNQTAAHKIPAKRAKSDLIDGESQFDKLNCVLIKK